MAQAFALSDFALLFCHLEIIPEAAGTTDREDNEVGVAESTGDAEDDWSELDLEGVRVRYFGYEEDDDLVLIANAISAEMGLPYRFDIAVGARFTAPDPPVAIEAARTTLLFMAYPYLRELVSGLTMRTPYPAFIMPPLTRLPHPQVTGEDAES